MKFLFLKVKKIKKFIALLVKSYFAGSFFLGLPQIISISVTLITLPIILANLSMKDYGLLQFVLAIQVWFMSLTAEHATSGAQRGIARGLDGTFLFAAFSRLRFVIPVGLFALLSALFVYYAGWMLFAQLLGIMGGFLIIGYLPEVSYRYVFIAKKQFKEFAAWKIATSIVIPVASATAAVLTQDILIFTFVHFGSTALIGWIGLLYVVIKNHLFSAYKEGNIDKKSFPYGIKMIPASLVLQTSNKITDFIIGPFFGFANLAVFSIARNLETRARSPVKIIQHLLYPDFAKDGWDNLIQKIQSKLKDVFLVSVFIAMGFAIIGYLYIVIFLPSSYVQSAAYFLILVLGLPAAILQTILHTAFASALRYKELSVLLIIPNIFKILFIVTLGFFFGIIGVVWSLTLSAWLTYFFSYVLFTRPESVAKILRKTPFSRK